MSILTVKTFYDDFIDKPMGFLVIGQDKDLKEFDKIFENVST